MNKKWYSLIVWIAPGLALAPGAAAATRSVPQQYSTIGAAIAAAHNGDRVIVADGVYSGQGNRDLDVAGKHIKIRSENGPANCIIDCESRGRAFYFHSGDAGRDAGGIHDSEWPRRSEWRSGLLRRQQPDHPQLHLPKQRGDPSALR